MLSIGAALLGAGHVLGVDCDADALNVALDNCEEFEGIPVKPSTPTSNARTGELLRD